MTPRRGEPRGTRARGADLATLNLGACIDCELCVQVCPTGIDIRDGLQYECIGCAACVDVCDDVMAKMQYPKGLIRFTTQHAMANAGPEPERSFILRRLLRPRILVYTAVLVALTLGVAGSLA